METRIREIMEERGINGIELAERLGINQSTASKLLRSNLSLVNIEKIASALGVPVWQLFADPSHVEAECAARHARQNRLQAMVLCPCCGERVCVTLKLQ